MKHQNNTNHLTVIARAPFHIYYEGPARMVSAANQVGNFDILPGHADFFSVLSPCKVVIDTEKGETSSNISNGILSVKGYEATLFVNI